MPIEPVGVSVEADTVAPASLADVSAPCPDTRSLALAEWRRRRSLERELHDGPAQHISAWVLKLALVRHLVDQHVPDDGDPASPQHRLNDLLNEFGADLADTLAELRRICAAVYPPLLHQAGLGPALHEQFIAEGVSAAVRATDVRFGVAVEGAAYFAVLACLAVQPKPTLREVVVSCHNEPGARVMVLDLVGVGQLQAEAMMEHICQMGGQVRVATQEGIPTSTARIPCA